MSKEKRGNGYVGIEEFKNMNTSDIEEALQSPEVLITKNSSKLADLKGVDFKSNTSISVCEHNGAAADGEYPLSALLNVAPALNLATGVASDTIIHCAMDIGSTHQRVKTFTLDLEKQSDVICLDTPYNLIDEDETVLNCKPASTAINDNLDMTIVCLNPKEETMVKKARVVKGSMMQILNRTPRGITADVSKVDAMTTYINIVCNAAIVTLLTRLDQKCRPSEKAIIDLTVSIPPDDANIKERTDSFVQRLEGEYKVTFNTLNTTVTVCIKGERIKIASEPLAAAFYTVMDEDFDQDSTSIFLDCGGRSSGIVAYTNGTLMEASSYAFAVGGSNMLNMLADKIASEHKIQRPRIEVLNKTIKTGIYKFGSKKINVINCIDAVKKEMAEAIYNGLSQGISFNQLQSSDVETIFCSGRSFGITHSEQGESPSLCKNIQKLYAEKSPYTVFARVADEFAIVRGLVYVRIREEF